MNDMRKLMETVASLYEDEDWNVDNSPEYGLEGKCPRCGSVDVSGELHPDISPSTTRMVCNDCGHKEHIETVPANKGL